MAMEHTHVPATHNPKSTAQIAGHPIHAMLVPFPIAFLLATLAADVVYWTTSDTSWSTAAVWLLATGIGTALLAAGFGFIDFIGDRRIRTRVAWTHFLGNLTAVGLSAVNLILRFAMGAEAGSATGIWISAAVVLMLLVTGWLGGEMVYRGRVGVADEPK
jgi:uncharacterized membrane protein